MNIFKRLFRIGQAEIHAAIEKMEDPIKMTEQGLRELRDDLAKATEAYAQVKSLALRTKNEQEQAIKEATTYGEKAVLILQKGQRNELDKDKAESLAKEALTLKRRLTEDAIKLGQQAEIHQQTGIEMMGNIQILQDNLNKWEKELKTIKARIKVSDATQQVNKQLSQIDSDNTLAMLERMKNKVEDKEALAQAYGEIAKHKMEAKNEIDKIINDDSISIDNELHELKKQLGI
jgi:phage shock protein A